MCLLRTPDITNCPLFPVFPLRLRLFRLLTLVSSAHLLQLQLQLQVATAMAKVSLKDLSAGGSRQRHLFPSLRRFFSLFLSSLSSQHVPGILSKSNLWHFISVFQWCNAYWNRVPTSSPHIPNKLGTILLDVEGISTIKTELDQKVYEAIL